MRHPDHSQPFLFVGGPEDGQAKIVFPPTDTVVMYEIRQLGPPRDMPSEGYAPINEPSYSAHRYHLRAISTDGSDFWFVFAHESIKPYDVIPTILAGYRKPSS